MCKHVLLQIGESLQKFLSVLHSARLWACAVQIGSRSSAYPNHRTMVCAVSLLMPNSSAINLSVSRRSCSSICCTFSIISGVLHVDGWPERGSSSVVPSLRESVWTIRKHIFFPRLPSLTSAETFQASPLHFSPICSRIWCLHVVPLCCDTTSHTDYIQLAAVGLHCRSHLCVDSPHVS